MRKEIKPQEGFQNDFLSSPADIVIGGGAAGAGKSFALLLEPLRFTDIKDFSAIIFRRTTPQITAPGGLWDGSVKVYTELNDAPVPVAGNNLWRFSSGAKIQFRHLQHEANSFDYQGAEIPFIGWDELTHFTKNQFFYLLSRNRSTCGIKPYIRATCNPQSFGWVKEMIGWWLYPDDYHIESLQGYPRPERAGVVRYFIQENDRYIWGDTKEEVMEKCPDTFMNSTMLQALLESKVNPDSLVKSLTFIPGTIYQNKFLLASNPGYLGNLMALSNEEKVKLLGGCWKLQEGEDQIYQYSALRDLFTNDFIDNGKSASDKYLTADIALEGSDKFVIGIWWGWRLKKVVSVDKSDGKEVLNLILKLAKEWGVPHSNICYDSDGVGGFIKGFLKSAYSFHGGGSPIQSIKAKALHEKMPNYQNLRTQCYYELGPIINNYEMYIEDDSCASAIVEELHATRKKPHDGVSKLRILSKEEIKNKLGGRSPDYGDMVMMRMVFELRGTGKAKASVRTG